MVAIQWVGYPRSYTKGRTRPIQFVCLHYTAGREGITAAEDGARYDKVRTDGTSTHFFTDSAGPALQEVPDGDRAHTARQHGNEIGIHIEICGTVQTRAQWLDATSYATLQTTAGLTALLLKRHNLPLRRMTTAEVRQAYYGAPGSRPKGICEHYDCTKAFPEDQGSHSDVGAGFPWDVFLSLVEDEMGPTTQGSDDMIFAISDGPRKGYAGRAGGGTHEFAATEAQLEQWRKDQGGVATVYVPEAEVRNRLGVEVSALMTGGSGGLVPHVHSLDAPGANTGPAITN